MRGGRSVVGRTVARGSISRVERPCRASSRAAHVRRAGLALLFLFTVSLMPRHDGSAAPNAHVATAQCVTSIGPGIPPPASVPSGIPGFHASWYGQSGYPTLCPGQRTTAVVAFYNSGSRGWIAGRAGETAFLGIPDPTRSAGISSDPGWPAADRVAMQPAAYVGPNQVAWFQFSVTAPATPGKYRLYIRPVIEGTEWMEDEGVFWELSVIGQRSDSVAIIPTTPVTATIGTERVYTAVSSDGGCLDLALVDEGDVRGDGSVADVGGLARLASGGTVALSGAPPTATVGCAPVGADHLLRFSVRGTTPGEIRPIAFRDLDGDHAVDVATEPYALGGAFRSLPPDASRGPHLVTVGTVDLDEHFLIDTQGAAVYRFDLSDRFERNGVSFTVAWFQELLSRGDVLNVSYEPDPSATSTFTFINDLGRQSPTARVVLDSWDGGTTQNDVGITLTEPTFNVDGIAYLLERATAFFGSICDGSSGAYNAIASVVVPGGDTVLYVDRDLPVGAYCYRVGVSDLLTAETAYTYTTRVNVANPPAPVARPRSIDARLTQNGGSLAALDAGDAFKLAFDKGMGAPGTATVRFTDVDGTAAEVRCGAEAACTLSTVTESIGGVLYEAGTVMTIAVIAAPRVLTIGSVAGLGAPSTIVFGDLRDFAGNAWDLAGSTDLVVGAPD